MPEPSIFGRRLKEVRDSRGWTQLDLSGRAKIPPAMISHFETGVRGTPSADNLVKLANALEVTIDYLLGRSEDPQVASERFSAAFRGLATASSETVDSALTVVQSLVQQDRERKQESDERQGADSSPVRDRPSRRG
jgi:transcriptional regulator with XRE-family HTH domain